MTATQVLLRGLVLILLLPVLPLVALVSGPAAAEPLELVTVSRPMNPQAPEETRLGPLTWRGGLEITSPDQRFGGLSGLLVSADGRRLTAVTDQGHWVSARMIYDREGNLSGLAEAKIAPLHGPKGEHLNRKKTQDAEDLARLPDGSLLVAFERKHRIWRYPARQRPLSGRPRALDPPPGLDTVKSNSGMEALAALPGGGLLAIVEGGKTDAQTPAYLWRGGAWTRFGYRREGRFRPSGATLLPNGDVLVVERRFNVLEGLGIRLVRLAAAALDPGPAPGTVLEGKEIARLLPPLTLDNMEGVAARRGEAGETLITLVSDDNFNAIQRTLLLVFALQD
jgi:hypothetical protein